MRPDLVLDVDEKKRRFKNFFQIRGHMENLESSQNVILASDTKKTNDTDDDDDDTLRETAAVAAGNVEKIYSELADHESCLDPETGRMRTVKHPEVDTCHTDKNDTEVLREFVQETVAMEADLRWRIHAEIANNNKSFLDDGGEALLETAVVEEDSELADNEMSLDPESGLMLPSLVAAPVTTPAPTPRMRAVKHPDPVSSVETFHADEDDTALLEFVRDTAEVGEGDLERLYAELVTKESSLDPETGLMLPNQVPAIMTAPMRTVACPDQTILKYIHKKFRRMKPQAISGVGDTVDNAASSVIRSINIRSSLEDSLEDSSKDSLEARSQNRRSVIVRTQQQEQEQEQRLNTTIEIELEVKSSYGE